VAHDEAAALSEGDGARRDGKAEEPLGAARETPAGTSPRW
jgi:hypothetical protein